MTVKLVKKVVYFGLIATIVALAILMLQLFRFQNESVSIPDPDHIFVILPGASIKTIAQNLVREKIIDDPWLFILLAKLKGAETRMRVGEYRLQSNLTPSGLLDVFAQGKSIQYSQTVIEGWNFRQMLAELENNPMIVSTIQGKTDAEIMTLLGYPGQHPEGMFFPDTYRFPRGTSDIKFLQRAYGTMQAHLKREWDLRSENLPLKTSYEALVLASIIEKETGVAHERPLIASVFIRRLQKDIKLQTDPTIIYGLGENFDGNIRYRDLKIDTPYNTYLHKGLTPTPIALPGLDSIRAALHPADKDALYFVAKGDGTHYFSKTLQQHNEAVIKYQLNGRKPK